MKRKMEDLSVDEFFKKNIGNDDNSTDEESNSEYDETGEEQQQNKDSTQETDSEAELDFDRHKKSLKKLKDTEPEFYKFLEENDRDLLNFDVDSESDGESQEGDESSKKHKLPSSLQVASDESDDGSENEDEDRKTEHKKIRSKITSSVLKGWSKELKEPKPVSTIIKVIASLKSAVELLSDENTSSAKRVQNSKALNGLLRLTLVDLVPAFNRVLNIAVDAESFQPNSSRSWKKMQTHVKTYLILIIKVLGLVNEDQIVKTLLKHVLQLVSYYGCFPKISKALLKRLVTIWSTSEESVRVLSFMGIVRVTRLHLPELLPFLINSMYVSYVKNCKFTSPTTWPLINFMKHSLVEIFALDQAVTYQHAFVYIRQMAIHLRNAVTVKKKDANKTVYNWQFVHCLYLWSQMMGTLHPSAVLQPLIYPLVQVIIGTIKLIPTTKYIPLRFYCIRALILLSKETNTFIPVLPLLTEIFDFFNVTKQPTATNLKPADLDFICALKLSKSQITEKRFKDAVIDKFYELVFDYTITQAHTIAFPELVLPSIVQMKAFMKTCRVGTYNKQIKQIIDKLEENSRRIEKIRSTAVLNLADAKAIQAWENTSKQTPNPLSLYYEKYRQLKDREVQFHISKKDELEDHFPEIERTKAVDKEQFADLFADNSSDDDDDSFLLKTKEIGTVESEMESD